MSLARDRLAPARRGTRPSRSSLPPPVRGGRGTRPAAAASSPRRRSRSRAATTLPDVRVAYETWGTLRRANAVLVLHALTGDSHVAGDAGLGHPTPGWWAALIGPGRAVDTDRWFVVAPNVLGGCQGTTGPSSAGTGRASVGLAVPADDRARPGRARGRASPTRWASTRWAAVLGGSMGGMRALEWAVIYPERVERLLLLCVPGGGVRRSDRVGVAADRRDPRGPGLARRRLPRPRRAGRARTPGLGVARRIAHAPTATGEELDTRFGRRPQPGEDPGGRRALRDRELPRPPRREARPPLRRRQLRRADPGDERPRRRPRPGLGRRRPGPHHRAHRRRRLDVRPALPAAPAGGARRAHPGRGRGAPDRVAVRARRVPHRGAPARADPRGAASAS